MNNVFIKNYPSPRVNYGEILRYSGCKEENAVIKTLLEDCLLSVEKCASYRVCYTVLPFSINGDTVDFGFAAVQSKMLASYLSNCEKALFFGATVGMEIDRLIVSASVTKPSAAVMYQAVGAERCESLCDAFCDDIKKEVGELKPRISAGYGDLPLEFQRDIFRLLSLEKIGITLNDSCLMTPTKSVTAIVGIKNR